MKPRKFTLIFQPVILLILFLSLTVNVISQTVTNEADEEYASLIKKADQHYDEQKLEKALYEYEKASRLKPEEQYPKTKIGQLSQVLDQKKTDNVLFEVAITSAEEWFALGDYKRAKAEYESALRIDPKAQFPKDRLQQISKIWADPQVEAAYAAAIKRADALYADMVYVDAKEEYITASDLKPYEQYPLDRILEINEILALLKETEEKYQNFITLADQYFDEKQYNEARENYVEATDVKLEEPYPKERITLIDNILAELSTQREEYDRVIALADQYYIDTEFEKAKIEYIKAAEVMPDDRYATSMIEKIDPLIAQFNEMQQSYELAINNGDRLFQENSYEDARDQYQNASQMFPDEVYPKQKINEINTLLGDLAAKDEAYNNAIAQADQYYTSLEYMQALQYYQDALEIKPGEQHPIGRIQMIADILADINAKEEGYQSAITKADNHLNNNEYELAKESYQNALTYKPDEDYPFQKIDEINQIVSELQDLEYRYSEVVKDADDLFAQGKYTQSKVAFQNASSIKPDESYPGEKILEIDGILEDRATLQAYDAAIASAEKYFKNRDYENSKNFFLQAQEIKPDETLPLQRITEIDNIIAQLELNDAYSSALSNADNLFKNADYTGALQAYIQVSEMKPGEQYPKDKIAEINTILANREANDNAFNDAIALADQYFNSKEYENALTEYQKAQNVYPQDEYVKGKINEVKTILAELEDIHQQYAKAIDAGDKLYEKNDYADALVQYGEAINLKPDEQYPKDKKAEIEVILADREALQLAFNGAIAAADEFYNENKYNEALGKYQEALNLMPAEKYPSDKINEINQLLADLEDQQNAYNEAIAAAEIYLENEDYNNALSQFQRAQNIKPEDQYPKEQIALITQLLADIVAQQKAYDEAIAAGDGYYKDKNWEKAKNSFQEALQVKPDESYPAGKITEIEGILAAILSTNQQYDNAIADADNYFSNNEYESALQSYQKAGNIKPEEQYPKTKINEINGILSDLREQQKDYEKTIASADRFFEKLDYNNAKLDYERAVQIKPDEEYPKNRIIEIDQILADMAATQKAYDDAIAAADGLMNDQNYEPAKEKYEEASSIKPREQYPKDQIVAINSILLDLREKEENYANAINNGDKFFNDEEYQRALNSFEIASRIKPEESYPQDKIIQITNILETLSTQEAYDEAVAAAERYFREEDYERALTNYTNASTLKPEEQYPIDKIAEIEGIFANRQANQEGYDNTIASGDQFFNEQDFQNALSEYQKAVNFLPDEAYPKSQIVKIEELLAGIQQTQQAYDEAITSADGYSQAGSYQEALRSYQEAAKIKPDESYPGTRISEINTLIATLAATADAYTDAIREADRMFKNKEFEAALGAYQEAKTIKPDESYPDEKITEINNILADLQKEENYNRTIGEGDNLFAENKYSEALVAFQRALEIKPEEIYPQEKISETEQILADIQVKQSSYNDAISLADNYYNNKEYEDALEFYQEAQSIYPDESYPNNRIEELNDILANLKLQEAYDAAIAEADRYFNDEEFDNARTAYQNALNLKPSERYPQDQINEINNIMLANEQARQEAFDRAIASADQYYSVEDYKNAKVQYQNAVGLKPDDQYAKGRLKEVEDILLAREIELREVYQNAIAKADNLYNKKILDEAIEAYRDAKAIKPDESYPDNMINQIRKYIEDHTILDITTTPVIITNNTDKTYDYVPVDIRKRRNNYILLKARVVGEEIPKLYLTYGVGAQKSGGIVLTKIREGDVEDYLIRVSAQDPWYRNDNNWMKLYSEGGDIEITSIQISQGD